MRTRQPPHCHWLYTWQEDRFSWWRYINLLVMNWDVSDLATTNTTYKRCVHLSWSRKVKVREKRIDCIKWEAIKAAAAAAALSSTEQQALHLLRCVASEHFFHLQSCALLFALRILHGSACVESASPAVSSADVRFALLSRRCLHWHLWQ